MGHSFEVFGIKTGLISPGDDISTIIFENSIQSGGIFDGDIIVIAESALATAEGRVFRLDDIVPSKEAKDYAEKFGMSPALAQIVIDESDSIIGGIPGFLLCMKNETLLPNAGIDGSNAPDGTVVALPKNPDASAAMIQKEIRKLTGVGTGVIIADSRTHAMRLGCSGVAIGCYGITSVTDERGKKDLFGRELEVTQLAVADNIASAAELVMGEADECTPVAVIRGLDIEINDESGIHSIEPSECLFMGVALNSYPSLFHGKTDTK
ncbi:MAG: coenzyme F420-0:L-glutamate ligase [Methanomicrobiaceae archaeon]|nr:coenzyme F420-0:L-glutamate ligase [Methanomicrobiaceae archaeon]